MIFFPSSTNIEVNKVAAPFLCLYIAFDYGVFLRLKFFILFKLFYLGTYCRLMLVQLLALLGLTYPFFRAVCFELVLALGPGHPGFVRAFLLEPARAINSWPELSPSQSRAGPFRAGFFRAGP
jgi:hypothetical protein